MAGVAAKPNGPSSFAPDGGPKSPVEQNRDRVDCVLLYPPWTVISGRSFLTNCLPPLGILSIASNLEAHGYSVRIIDIHAERIGPEEVARRLEQWRPRFAGVTVLSSMVVAANALMKLVKIVVPDCVTVMGGVHAEAYPEVMLRNSAVDLVVRGDGEEPMLQLLLDRRWSEIDGLCFRNDQREVVVTPIQPLTMDLDRYPMPAYHLIDMNRYFPSATSYRNLPAINVILTRGCPGKCTFCNSARTALRSRSPRKVFEQIQHLRDRYGIRQVQFFDDTFTANKQGVLELCRLLREHKVDVTFTCYARGDCFGVAMARALKSAGCHQVMVGIETGSDRISRIIGKPIDKEKYRNLVRIAHEHGIEVRAGFIIGNLGETWTR